MKAGVIIAAGGIGKRMEGNKPKQFLELNGKPIICHTLERFISIKQIEEIVVVLASDAIPVFQKEVAEAYSDIKNIKIVEGGKERQDSVNNGLKALSQDIDVVLIHDAARPFIRSELINKAIDVAFNNGAAIVATPIKDTIKKVDSNLVILTTVNREGFWGAQTPQAFQVKIIKEAFSRAYDDGFIGTDDASLVERLGGEVRIIRGDSGNIKITTQDDLIIAIAIAKEWNE